MTTKWLVMVYQSGDNNLSNDMVASLQEMQEVTSHTGLKITAQFDPVGAAPRFVELLPDRCKRERDQLVAAPEGSPGKMRENREGEVAPSGVPARSKHTGE